jgi:serine/threonine protein kinase
VFATHRTTQRQVAIKKISQKAYKNSKSKNKISETAALNLCRESKHVVNLVESMKVDNSIYLVTKYAQGGNLLQYCLSQPNQERWLDEKRAHHIFA